MKEYTEDKNIEEIGNRLLKEFNFPEKPLVKFLKLIADNSSYLGKCSRATKKWKYLTDKDYIIEIWDKWWEKANETQKEALLFHELSHIGYQERNDNIIWKINDHDINEFNEVVKRYGAWDDIIKKFKSILNGE